VPWADEAEQQLSRLALSACELSADVHYFGGGLTEAPTEIPTDMFEVLGGKTSKQPQSLCLCASSAMDRWGWATAFQASSFWLRAVCRRSQFQSRAAGGPMHGAPKVRLKLEVARQASSPSLCASVQAVPLADEADKQLSRLALSVCKLSADVPFSEQGCRRCPARTT